MANEEHLAILHKGAEAWNDWRKTAPKVVPDLVGADLSGADLRLARLTGVDLRRANLGRTAVMRCSRSGNENGLIV